MFQIPLFPEKLLPITYKHCFFLIHSELSQIPPTLHDLHQIILTSLLPSVQCRKGTYQAIILIDVILGERIEVSEMKEHKTAI